MRVMHRIERSPGSSLSDCVRDSVIDWSSAPKLTEQCSLDFFSSMQLVERVISAEIHASTRRVAFSTQSIAGRAVSDDEDGKSVESGRHVVVLADTRPVLETRPETLRYLRSARLV